MKAQGQAQKKFLSRGFISPERIECPDILTLVMTQDVEVVVVRAHAETTVANTVPLIENLCYRVGPLGRHGEMEPQRPLVAAVSGITFDFEQGSRHGNPH